MQEISALVLAHAKGKVTNVKLRETVQIESSETTAMLKSLVDSNLLEAHGSNRNRVYTLETYFSQEAPEVSSKDTSEAASTPWIENESKLNNKKTFAMLQEKVRQGTIQPDEITMFIQLTCETNKKSAYELGEELSLTRKYLTRRYLRPLVKGGYLHVTRGARGLHFYQTIVD